MTPRFAQAVDPIYLAVLDLLDRIARGKPPAAQEAQLQIRALIDQAEAILGASQEWALAKYGLASWTDEVLVDIPWEGRDWWSNNVLEVQMFNTRNCSEQFYVKAQQASTLPGRDALEVFYNCVVLGFRGLYSDPTLASTLAQANGLPEDLETWARQTSLSIRLGQGRPEMTSPRREIRGAPPLLGKGTVVWTWLTALLLAVSNVVFYLLYFGRS
jgi:type VI secretion system protein ImpK